LLVLKGLLRQAYLRLLDTLAENLKRRAHHLRELEPTALIEQIFTDDRAGRTKKASQRSSRQQY